MGLSIVPLPSSITVTLKVSLRLKVDYRKELPNNWATEFSEKMNTAKKTAVDVMWSGSIPISVFMDPIGSNKKLLRE